MAINIAATMGIKITCFGYFIFATAENTQLFLVKFVLIFVENKVTMTRAPLFQLYRVNEHRSIIFESRNVQLLPCYR